MEQIIDNALENIFGGITPPLNIVAGLLLIVAGTVIFDTLKKQPSKSKRMIAWICIGIGWLGAISGIVQIILS